MANPSNHIAAAAASLALVGAFGAGAFALNSGEGSFDPTKFANAYAQGMNDSKEGYQANPSDADAQANRHDDGTEEQNQGDSSKEDNSQNNIPVDGASGTTALRVSDSGSSESGLVAGSGNGDGSQEGTGNGATGPALEPDSSGNNGNTDSGNNGSNSDNNGNSGGSGNNNRPSAETDPSYKVLPQDPTPSKDSTYGSIPVNRDGIVDGLTEGVDYKVTIEEKMFSSFSSYNIYKGQKLDDWALFCVLDATFSALDENGDMALYEWTCSSKEEFENYPYFEIENTYEYAPNEPFTITVRYRFDATNENDWRYQDVEINPCDSCVFISNGKKDENGNPVIIKQSYDSEINLLGYTRDALDSLGALDLFDETSELILDWKENGEVIDPFYTVEPGRHVVEVGDTAPVPDGCTVSVDYDWIDDTKLCYLQKLTEAYSDSPVFSKDENDDIVFVVPEGIHWVEPDDWTWPPFYADTFIIPSNTLLKIDGANSNLYVAKRYEVNPDNPRFAATENGILTNKEGNEYLAIPCGLEEVDIPAEVSNITLPSTQVDEITQKIVLQSHDADTLPSIEFPDFNNFNFEISEELFEQFANTYYANFDPEKMYDPEQPNKRNTLSLSTDPNANLYFKNGFMRNDGELYKAVETGAQSITLREGITVRAHCFSGAPSLNTLVISGTELPIFEEGCFEGSTITSIVCATEDQKKAVEESLASSGLADQVDVEMISVSQEGYSYAETDDDVMILSAPQNIEEFTGAITAEDGTTLKATKVGSDLFANNQTLKWAILDESVTEIGDNAFYGCKNLQGIFVANQDSISFGANAYADCDNLRFIASRAMNASFATKDRPGQCILWRLANASGYEDEWGYDYYDWFSADAVDDFAIDKVCDGCYALYASYESNPFLLLGIGTTVPDGAKVNLLPSTVQIWASTFRNIESNYTVNWEDLDALAFLGDETFRYVSDDTSQHAGLSGDVLITANGANASIGDGSFGQTDITSFTAETSWLCVEKNAFAYSPLLKTVKITAGASDPEDENAVSHLYSNAFDGCDSLESIEFTSPEPMDLITYNDLNQKSPFRLNGLLSQEEEAEKIQLIIPEEYRETYLRHWIYQFDGFTDYEHVYSYVARQLYAATDYKVQPTQEQIIEGVKQELLPTENNLRKMMGMPQVTEITIPLPQANGDVDYTNEEKSVVADEEAAADSAMESDSEENASLDESAKEEAPGSDSPNGSDGSADSKGSDEAVKPDAPSDNPSSGAADANSAAGNDIRNKQDEAAANTAEGLSSPSNADPVA